MPVDYSYRVLTVGVHIPESGKSYEPGDVITGDDARAVEADGTLLKRCGRIAPTATAAPAQDQKPADPGSK